MIKARTWLAIILGVMPVVCARPAAQAQPADRGSATTTPATTVATTSATTSTRPVAADPSTPKGALKALAEALDAGDRARVLELLSADTPEQRKWAEATADLAAATAALRRAASAGFGAEASRPLGVDVAATPEAIHRIEAATVTLTGDKAIVRAVDEEGPPLVLIRQADGWRVPVSEFSHDVESADLDRAVRALADETRLLRELAAEVSAGKYKTATDARQALDQRIMHAAMPQLEPAPASGTTRP